MQPLSVEQIKTSVRIEDVVRQRGIILRASQSGERLEGHCPFHAWDSTPSFNLYVASQRYHCFGCGADGDVIDFVQAFDRCTFQDALCRLSEKTTTYQTRDRIPRPAISIPFQFPMVAEENQWSHLLTKIHLKYHQTLLNHPFLPEMLRRARGITQEGIRQCELGYADGSLLPDLHCTPEMQEAMETIGLLSVATQQERMRGRLVIPECGDGICHWMIGRALYHPVEKQRIPKYLGLSLSKPLLGYGLALKRLGEGHLIKAILIVEGAIDYVIASQWNLPIVCVALIGTHASMRQLVMLLDLQERTGHVPLLIGLDADEAGRKASSHLLAQLSQRTSFVSELPPIADAKDIGDLGIHPSGFSLLQSSIEQALCAQGGQQ